MTAKEIALAALKIAAHAYKPLAELIERALDALLWDEPSDVRELANEVRAILPKRNAIHDAVSELEAELGKEKAQ